MLIFVNAKINLGLNVIRRRHDGYHDLMTCFYPVGKSSGQGLVPPEYDSLSDVIEVVESDADELVRTGAAPDCEPEHDLVWKALQLFRGEYPMAEGRKLRLVLEKHLPFGAGLGGGSADASATLRLLNDYFEAGFSEARLEEMAGRLGADCPFFIRNMPVAAEGTGNIFTPLSSVLEGWWCAIVKPEYSISTAEAFRGVSPRMPDVSPAGIVGTLPVSEWRGRLVNDFEESMYTHHPKARKIKEYFYECGAAYSAMSGSGSAFFGIFSGRDAALRALDGCGLKSRYLVRL